MKKVPKLVLCQVVTRRWVPFALKLKCTFNQNSWPFREPSTAVSENKLSCSAMLSGVWNGTDRRKNGTVLSKFPKKYCKGNENKIMECFDPRYNWPGLNHSMLVVPFSWRSVPFFGADLEVKFLLTYRTDQPCWLAHEVCQTHAHEDCGHTTSEVAFPGLLGAQLDQRGPTEEKGL